jgi:hypothetical protein
MSRNPRHFARILLAAIALMSVHSAAFAQATRTWVSGVGDDANPCSRTAPCKTFAGAISKTAAGGEINTLDGGGFGAVTITKSITIQSDQSWSGGILVSGTNGITVNAGANDVVTLSGLQFDGIGYTTATSGIVGVRFLAGLALNVEDCRFRGFAYDTTGAGIEMAPSGGNTRLYVSDSYFIGNGSANGGGHIVLKPTGTATVTAQIVNSQLTHSRGYGIYVGDNANATLRNTNIMGSYLSGAAAVNTNALYYADIVLRDSMLTNNGWGIPASHSAIYASGVNAYVHLSNNLVSGNNYAMRRPNNGKIYTFGNNSFTTNSVIGSTNGTEPQL